MTAEVTGSKVTCTKIKSHKFHLHELTSEKLP